MENTAVTQINVPFPEASDLHLRFNVGACHLAIKPGDSEPWVTGTYRDPSGALPAKVLQEGGTVRITQGQNVAELFRVLSGGPRFDLALGKGRPYTLTMETGASELDCDLGGLPIGRLAIRQGAGRSEIDFSVPNLHPMSLLELAAGAAGMEVKNLANTTAAEMRIDGGAAGYTFDFGGSLQRDAHARINTGMSTVDIRVPTATPVKITAETMLGSLDVGDGFTKREGAFWNEAALKGNTPVLTIDASVALGMLRLRVT